MLPAETYAPFPVDALGAPSATYARFCGCDPARVALPLLAAQAAASGVARSMIVVGPADPDVLRLARGREWRVAADTPFAGINLLLDANPRGLLLVQSDAARWLRTADPAGWIASFDGRKPPIAALGTIRPDELSADLLESEIGRRTLFAFPPLGGTPTPVPPVVKLAAQVEVDRMFAGRVKQKLPTAILAWFAAERRRIERGLSDAR